VLIGDRALYIAPNGQQYSFAPPTFIIQEDGALGTAPIEYVTQRGPFQHGESVKAFFLRPRTIQVIVRRQGISRNDYHTLRAQIMNILAPNTIDGQLRPGIFRKYLSNGVVREYEVFVTEGPSFPSHPPDSWDEWSIRDTIRFTAYDPVARDPAIQGVQYTVPLSTGGTFPLTFPIQMASFGIAATAINYVGNWLSYPTIYITGPVFSPSIINQTTGEQIVLAYSIPMGFTVIIDLSYGQKSVVRNDGVSLIGYITNDSDLGTFHLAPGVNQIQVLGTGTSPGSTSILVQWYNRYLGAA
jgi:Phage tail protein.